MLRSSKGIIGVEMPIPDAMKIIPGWPVAIGNLLVAESSLLIVIGVLPTPIGASLMAILNLEFQIRSSG